MSCYSCLEYVIFAKRTLAGVFIAVAKLFIWVKMAKECGKCFCVTRLLLLADIYRTNHGEIYKK